MASSLVSLASLLDGFQPSAPEVLVSAIIHHGGRLLMIERQHDGQRYWALPGARLRPRETLEAALRRALRVSLRLDARIGPLLIVGEVLAPDRHVVHLIFQARLGGASRLPLTALDPYVGLDWVDPTRLARLELPPPIARALMEVVVEGFSGPVKMLGDIGVIPPVRRRSRRGMVARQGRPGAFPDKHVASFIEEFTT
jgi:ADP-ribose pyrophosphatase YjhB (NUDIX family)